MLWTMGMWGTDGREHLSQEMWQKELSQKSTMWTGLKKSLMVKTQAANIKHLRYLCEHRP